MKRYIICVTLFFITAQLLSQAIPNGNFENYINTNYNDPSFWFGSNIESIEKINAITTTSVNGFSGSAVRIETKTNGADVSEGYIINTDKDILAGEGGMPFTQKPTNVTGYLRYNLLGNDTGFIWIMFKKSGLGVISSDFIKIRGTGTQLNWTSFNYSLSLNQVPDTFIIAICNSNTFGNNALAGSFIEIDQLNFTGVGITQTITNGNFENWTVKNHEVLSNWSRYNKDNISKTGSAQNGSAAISLTTVGTGTIAQYSAISNGNFDGLKGRPYTLMQDTLFGYYKFNGSALDSATIEVYLYNGWIIAGMKTMHFKNTPTWKQFKMPLSASQTPDTLRIVAYSSVPWPTSSVSIGSVFTLDNIYLRSQPVGMQEQKFSPFSAKLFPNPANNYITLTMDENVIKAKSYSIYDVAGKNVLTGNILQGENVTVSIESLNAGVYILAIETEKGQLKNKFIKQ